VLRQPKQKERQGKKYVAVLFSVAQKNSSKSD
jgi:hypothetical protein